MTLAEPAENFGNVDLGPLVEIHGNELRLRGWRGLSLINIGTILLPIILGIIAFLSGGWWRLVGLGLFTFSAYGCWIMYRSTTAYIKILNTSISIDGHNYEKSRIKKFVGRRLDEPSGVDDNESSVQLWLITSEDREIPVIQMSGYVKVETIAAYLNDKLTIV